MPDASPTNPIADRACVDTLFPFFKVVALSVAKPIYLHKLTPAQISLVERLAGAEGQVAMDRLECGFREHRARRYDLIARTIPK
ncbi:MAG: hypothetical protein QM744_01325 [Mesorhizobium sp.]